MTTPTNWTLAILVLSSGLLLGFLFIVFTRRKTTRLSGDAELRDLEAKRDALVQQIRELPDGEERQRLEVEAAAVLRQIDGRQSGEGRKAAAAQPAPSMSPRLAFVLGIVTTLALGGLAALVMKFATNRETAPAPAAMQPAGELPPGHPAVDPAVQSLEAGVQAEPENLEKRIELARAYLDRDNLMGVFEQTEYVLTKTPDDPRALTYQALVRIGMGEAGQAKEMLQRALKADPNFLDASIATAWLQMQEGKKTEAEKTLQVAIKQHPDEKGRIEQVRDRMMSHQQAAAAAPAPAADNLPPGHPPLGDADPVPPLAAGPGVQITLDLDSASKSRLTANNIIYVVAREDGKSAGAPILVKRVETETLPITFELSAADSMMGQALPAKIRVEARLDSDGDAATKNPSDPFGAQNGVAAGSSITLAMK